MSDYHVLSQGLDKMSIRVAFHISIPNNVTNAAGIPYSQAVADYLGAEETVSKIPNHATNFPAEATAMSAGEIYEYIESVKFSGPDLTNAEKKAVIDARYTELASTIQNKMQTKLEWWGANFDV